MLTTALALGCAGCKTLDGLFRKSVKEPQVRFVQLHLRDLSLESVTMDFEMEIDNPNPVGVTLERLDYDLAIDGKRFVSGESDRKLRVAAQGSEPVRLPLTLTFAELAEGVALLLSDRDTVPYRLGVGFGVMTPVGEVRIPIRNEGDVPLPKLPEVSFGDIRLAQMSLRGARLEISMNVRNRGSFPIRPEGLRYDLALAGVSVSSGDQRLPEIGAEAAQRVVVPVQLDFLRVGVAAVEAVRSKRLPYRLEGALDLGFFEQPFTLSGVAPL